MNLTVLENADELSKHVADWLVDYIQQTLQQQDRFTIVLSGGSTPKKLYALLATEEYKNKIEWEQLHFFWGDERAVPFSDERNNARMAFDILLNHVPVRKEQVHIMQTDIEPTEAVVAYEKTLKEYFANTATSFDLVLLGMGGDGHTLSLFPGYENIYEKDKWVMSFFLKEQNMQRITLTASIVNHAACIAFLVAGADKAVALSEVLIGDHNPDQYPSQLIQPNKTAPIWFVDEKAAMDLEWER